MAAKVPIGLPEAPQSNDSHRRRFDERVKGALDYVLAKIVGLQSELDNKVFQTETTTTGTTTDPVLAHRGDMLYFDADLAALLIGTQGQVLTVDLGLPAWRDQPPAFNPDSILTGFGEVLVGYDGNVLTGLLP